MAETAALLGFGLMPWQELVVDVALEHDGGQLVHHDVVVSVPRQSGKTSLILAVVVHRMLAAPGVRVAYAAQTRVAARSKLLDTWWPLLRRSTLRGLFTVTRAMGGESLRAANGSVLMVLSTEEAAGHGETIDLGILDETWALDVAAEQAVRPAMVTRPNAQLWMLSTAGTARSVFWRSRVEAGRAAVKSDEEGLAFFEWSVPPEADLRDTRVWEAAMPALGHTVNIERIKGDLRVMPPAEWKRAYCNMWPDEADEGWRVIPRDVWAASRW